MDRKAAIIKDGIVENVIVIDDNTPSSIYDVELEAGSNVGPGWRYEKKKFIEPEQAEEDTTEES